ncbi:hypothetical protein M0657_002054 [Pyricularia oryzae]|nr:hypothetical protein M9X92_001519 [Pyricularia oryzae]KAI7929577.1 hypothetical protein M0657_002054 [Pyricularia oryzae]
MQWYAWFYFIEYRHHLRSAHHFETTTQKSCSWCRRKLTDAGPHLVFSHSGQGKQKRPGQRGGSPRLANIVPKNSNASFSSSISSSRVPREVETSTEDPCTMVDKGCEDINVKAEMARQDEASIVHVAYHRVGHPFLVTSTYSVPKFDQRSARTLCNVRGTPLEHASKKGAMMRGPPLQEKREHKPNKVATNIYCTNGLERR